MLDWRACALSILRQSKSAAEDSMAQCHLAVFGRYYWFYTGVT